jgi:hypothetical protein
MPFTIIDVHSRTMNWLTSYLTENGPTRRSQVMAAAVAAGYTESGANKAARALNLHVTRGAARGGPTTWRLPTEDETRLLRELVAATTAGRKKLPTMGAEQ